MHGGWGVGVFQEARPAVRDWVLTSRAARAALCPQVGSKIMKEQRRMILMEQP
jgi:hypothetical protein